MLTNAILLVVPVIYFILGVIAVNITREVIEKDYSLRERLAADYERDSPFVDTLMYFFSLVLGPLGLVVSIALRRAVKKSWGSYWEYGSKVPPVQR